MDRCGRVLEPFGLQRAEDLKSPLRSMIALHRTPAADEPDEP